MRVRWLRAACIGILLLTQPAQAAKWVDGCPRAREKTKRVGKLVVTPVVRFIHVGHDVTLRAIHVGRRWNGFSIEPDAYGVDITFHPLGGDPIPLPQFTVTATSPHTLSFPFPDSTPTLGRMVVGSFTMEVHDLSDLHRPIAKFRPLVALPPANDIHALAQGDEVEALGAASHKGGMWIPLNFGGYGPGEPMPSCPAPMTPIVRFAIDFTLKKGDDQAIPHTNFAELRRTSLYLGDFLLEGMNLYGTKTNYELNVSHLRGNGFILCKANDTLDAVMHIAMTEAAKQPGSDIVPLVSDGSPFRIKLRNVSSDPDVVGPLAEATSDSLGNVCDP